MTSKHSISCVALSAAVAFKLFAGTADLVANGAETDARKGRVLLTVLHDASGRLDGARFYAGRFIFSGQRVDASRQRHRHRRGRRRDRLGEEPRRIHPLEQRMRVAMIAFATSSPHIKPSTLPCPE